MAFGVLGSDKAIPANSVAGYSEGAPLVKPARVKSVVLSENDLSFNYFSKWQGIGSITFEFLDSVSEVEGSVGTPAIPYFANLRIIPVVGEIVLIISSGEALTSNLSNESKQTYYYLPSTNIWNSTHHNILPNELGSTVKPESLNKSLDEIELGVTAKYSTTPQTKNYTNGFEEKDIRPLSLYVGDVILEGRWGNSIRLGSTDLTSNNPWSSTGANGDPILILRNGQSDSKESILKPLPEQLQSDPSSIYLTSTQKLNIVPQNTEYNTYSFNGKNAPVSPNEYKLPQVVLKSSRVMISAPESLTSAATIHSSAKNFNVDATTAVTLESPRVNLGSGNPLDLQASLRGDEVVFLLNQIINVLNGLTNACATATNSAGSILSLQNFATFYKGVVSKLDTSTLQSEEVFNS